MQALGPKQWMYINVILERSELLLPKAHAPEPRHAQSETVDTGLLTEWSGLRVGYFWGGYNETILRINANDLSTSCQLAPTQQPQASTLSCVLHTPDIVCLQFLCTGSAVTL